MLRRGLFIALLCTILDQVHKYIMIDIMASRANHPIEVTSFFKLVMVWNPGISFGMFQQIEHPEYILSALALTIVAVLIFWLRSVKHKLECWSLALIIGGAIGNVIDRLHYGAVADFFYFYIDDYHWPAFNIADSAVFIGAVLLILDSLRSHDVSSPTPNDDDDAMPVYSIDAEKDNSSKNQK